MPQFDSKIQIDGFLSKDYKIPELELFFSDYNKTFIASIDTGAYESHITTKTIMELGLDASDSIGLSREEHPINGFVQNESFNLKFQLNKNDFLFTEKFVMMPKYQYAIILGSDFLARCKEFNYYGESKTFRLIL